MRNQGVLELYGITWQTQWSGVVSQTTETTTIDFEEGISRKTTVETTRTDLTRTGVIHKLVENIEEESLGNRVISRQSYLL